MLIEVLTLFPGYFRGPLEETILKRAAEAGVVSFRVRDVRDYAPGKHRVCDDTPFGGGPGMVLKAEPVVGALEAARSEGPGESTALLLSPAGAVFDQARAAALATDVEHLILVCGRYEGVDERVLAFVDGTLCIGDYVLSGGEAAACSVIDAVVRLLPGALGHPDSPRDESFVDGCLEYPQYTRPREFRGMAVPDVLLSGDHAAISAWRRRESLRRTLSLRPDLLAQAPLSERDREILEELKTET